MFEINNVSKKYNTEYAVKNLNLEIGNGLNFIIGASGSGKTTLLKILSGLENDYEGEVLYCKESIKNLTKEQIADYYNNKFGFVYQDFNLIEDMTVKENILLPIHLKDINTKDEVEKILRKLKITTIKDKKVNLLSGGQKQRVAIARELVKNPEVIIADEPTSALDPKTATEVIQILREISKERTVIIVTHDTSLIDDKSKVYELDKGEIISKAEIIDKNTDSKKNKSKSKFDILKAIKVGKTNIKSRLSKSIVASISIIVSTLLLITSMGGFISNSGAQEFEKLYSTYGNTALDLGIVSNFSSASSGFDEDDTTQKTVNQDIEGLYQKYEKDDRVDMIYFEKAFDNIQVKVNEKDYYIESTGNVPVLQEILVGTLAKNKGEVLVPESFVKQMGISNEEAIGKEIEFYATVYNHDSGEPIEKEVILKAKICGVINSTMVTDMGMLGEELGIEIEDEIIETDIVDSFFFDKYTLDEVNKQAKIKNNNHNFLIRAKDANSLIELKNELNAIGIVPIGAFELLGDIVNLENKTDSLSKASTIIISVLAVVILVAISLVTSIMRKKEYAIYKVCGYSNSQLALVLLCESLIIGISSAILIVVLSPVMGILIKTVFGTTITNITYLALGIVISLVLSMLLYLVSSIVAKKSNPISILK